MGVTSSSLQSKAPKWPTQNFKLMVVLRAMGFEACSRSYVDRTMWYEFPLSDELSQVVHDFTNGAPMALDAHAFWRAYDEVKMDLRRLATG